MAPTTITFGGWYQRTTLHMSEVYDLFALGKSNLDLDKGKLAEHQKALNLKSVTRETSYLEYVKAITADGIEIRYYEDGLYILQKESTDILKDQKMLENYFLNIMNPAISYIFSLGAPTPKILANIKTIHPTAITATSPAPASYAVDPALYGEVYQKIESPDVVVYKTPHHIIVVAKPELAAKAQDIVEMQIFFREFKDQLEKYLNVHRKLWEEISSIKERKTIRGNEVSLLRSKLDNYQKTITLIGNRINQMDTYISTRGAAARDLAIEDHLTKLFQFKFEVLSDTLAYIKELWKMTMDYLASAIQNMIEIKNQSAARGIQSLQLITSVGVISGIIGYLSKSDFPKITDIGALYFLLIIIATWIANVIITRIYTNKQYALNFAERTSNI